MSATFLVCRGRAAAGNVRGASDCGAPRRVSPCRGALRTRTRPPHVVCLPRIRPLSRARGARPDSLAISFALSRPSSGSSARSVQLTTGPIPGTLHSRCVRSCQRADFLIASCVIRSTSRRRPSRKAMCAFTSARIAARALRRRFFSATSIYESWRRRATRAMRACCSASGSGRTSGSIRSAYRASTSASMRSVFAKRPVARAKSRI
jgi:hypothetical protein